MADEVQVEVVETPKATEVLDSMNSDERKNWELTGKYPEKPKSEAKAASATPASEAKSEPETAKTEADSEPAKPAQEQEKGKHQEHYNRTERRIFELLGKNKALQAQIEELKRSSEVKPKAETTAGSAPAKPTTIAKIPEGLKAKIDALIENADQFERYEDLIAAIVLETHQSIGPETVKAILKQEAEAQEAAKVQEKVTNSWMKSVNVAAKKHADYGSVVDTPEMSELIPVGSPLNAILIDSEHGGEILYYLATHQDDIERINGLSPINQAREVFKIEQSLSTTSPVPTKTAAPEPPRTLGAGETVSSDPLDEALRNKDVGAYMRIANEQEAKRLRA
jgi:uncharacterized membrane protein